MHIDHASFLTRPATAPALRSPAPLREPACGLRPRPRLPLAPIGRSGGSNGTYRQRFSVEYDFPVCFTERLFDPANPLLADTLCRSDRTRLQRAVVLLDAGVAAADPQVGARIEAYFAHHRTHIALVAPPLQVEGGEAAKNDLSLVVRLQQQLVEWKLDRHAFVIAVGGGALLDLAGFVAATTHRGVRHVRVPTTVLAQDDSGVGVKNGVNAFGIKNLLGTFAPPFAVLNDFDLLAGLDPRDKRAGMAEAVKVALIRDAGFFQWIEQQAVALSRFDDAPLRQLVQRCAELHMQQIAHGGDPFERGSARPLDFGHWAAHKLEALSAHALRHGEAVAIGIALDTRYSVLAGLLPAGEELRVCRVLETLGFDLWHPALRQRGEDGGLALLAGLEEFREHLGGELTITLLAALGTGIEVHAMHAERIVSALDWLEQRARVRGRTGASTTPVSPRVPGAVVRNPPRFGVAGVGAFARPPRAPGGGGFDHRGALR